MRVRDVAAGFVTGFVATSAGYIIINKMAGKKEEIEFEKEVHELLQKAVSEINNKIGKDTKGEK